MGYKIDETVQFDTVQEATRYANDYRVYWPHQGYGTHVNQWQQLLEERNKDGTARYVWNVRYRRMSSCD